MDPLFYIALALILGAAFVNGWTDAPNAIASAIATRVMQPVTAVAMAAVMNIIGAFFGTAVAVTLGKGIVDPGAINVITIASALVGLIVWATVAWWFGLPTSESHGLIAGFAGAALATAGPGALVFDGWVKVGIGIVVAIAVGGVMSYIIGRAIIRYAHALTPATGKAIFDRLQAVGAAAAAFGHGIGDIPKFAGMFTATLLIGGAIPKFEVHWWVMALCALTVGLATLLGGWRIIGTMSKINRDMESWQGTASSFGASVTISVASGLGVPLSTTHTATSSLTGACASQSFARVDWRYPLRILYAAVLTFPACGLIAFATCKTMTYLFM